MENPEQVEKMKKYITIAFAFLLLLAPSVQAGSVIAGIDVESDGTSAIKQYLETSDGIVDIVEIENEGQMVYQWQVIYEDGSSEIIEYIQDHEDQWAQEGGHDMNFFIDKFEGAIDWLLGKDDDPDNYEYELAKLIDEYQRENEYTQELLARIIDLQYRVEALENTAESTNAEAYCSGKLEVLEAYGLAGMKCDTNGETTYYRNHLENPSTGEPLIIGLTPENGHAEKPENTASLEGETKVIIEELEYPDTIYFGEPFGLKATIKNYGSHEVEDYITIAVPEGWKLDAPSYYAVTLSGGQQQVVYFGVIPTTYEGEVAVGSSSDFKSTGIIQVQKMPVTTKMSGMATNFFLSMDEVTASLFVAFLVIPSLVWLKKAPFISGILKFIHIRRIPTEFEYRYKLK